MKEASNQCEHPMFDNTAPYTSKVSTEIRNSQNPGRPISDQSVETSNTTRTPITESAHDITVRTR